MRLALALAALTLLTACEGGGDPVESALRDTAAANHSAVTRETASAEPSQGAGHTTPSAGDQAFAASEAAMHERMMAASGGTIDEAYIAKMVEHHRGAVAMADVALARTRDPEIRRMAQAVKTAQTREIAEMQAWKPGAAQ